MVKIEICSFRSAIEYEPSPVEKTVMIRISEPDYEKGRDTPLLHEDKFADILHVSFYDVTDAQIERISSVEPDSPYFAIRTEDAEKILDFVDKHVDADRVLVHCSAGISRSPAVGIAIAGHFDLWHEERKIFDNDLYIPNQTVIERIGQCSNKRYGKEEVEVDIGSGSGYPSASLSNFTPHPFVIDGVECTSMEGFLQSLKFSNPDMQIEVCKLWGGHAKKKGSRKNKHWRRNQTLYWRGEAIPRKSEAYQELLDKAFDALAENEGFKKALLATGNATLTHSLGRNKENETVLTVREFCGRLTKIRSRLQKVENDFNR